MNTLQFTTRILSRKCILMHLYYKSKFLWDTHPADHEINRLICDINLGTEKRGLKAYPSLSLRVACSVVVSNCNASYWHVLAFNSCF